MLVWCLRKCPTWAGSIRRIYALFYRRRFGALNRVACSFACMGVPRQLRCSCPLPTVCDAKSSSTTSRQPRKPQHTTLRRIPHGFREHMVGLRPSFSTFVADIMECTLELGARASLGWSELDALLPSSEDMHKFDGTSASSLDVQTCEELESQRWQSK